MHIYTMPDHLDRPDPAPCHRPCPALTADDEGHDAAPRTVTLDLRVTVPAGTPMIDFARALSQLALAVNGAWVHRAVPGLPRGRFDVEGQP